MNTVLTGNFVIITLLSLIILPSLSSVYAVSHEIMPPKKQMDSGVEPHEVVCKTGLTLMIRTTNGAAACVKPTTSEKLSNAGWGTIEKEASMAEEHMDESHDKEIILEEELSMGEQEQRDDSNKTTVKLKEELSSGDNNGMPGNEKESFTIGGIDLSMAAPIQGDENAPITIIEFGDYQCPKCKDWFQNVKSTIESDYINTGTAKLYFIDSAWLGSDSLSAAQAAYCADDQAKFKDYHSMLYNNQAGIQDGWASVESLKQFAIDLELDSEQFNECLDSEKYLDRVSHNTAVGNTHGVDGTPYFFIVNPSGDIKKIPGPQPSIIFDAAINSLGY